MPIFRTPEEQADAISKLPESAMGFQLLDLSLEQWSDGYLFLALNSRFLVPANSLDELLRELQDLRGVTAEWLAESPDVSEVEVRGVDEEIGSIGIIKSWVRLILWARCRVPAVRTVRVQPVGYHCAEAAVSREA